MLRITIPAREYFNEKTLEFVKVKEQKLQLEHSLVSLSKWEAKWQKPFLGKTNLTPEEVLDYVRCMTITQNVPPETYVNLTEQNMQDIKDYIDSPMTATTFTEQEKRGGAKEVITAELIYYWMIANNIPWECSKWHLNRLITLIRVCSIKNQPPKKMSKAEVMRRNASLNAARKAKLNSMG